MIALPTAGSEPSPTHAAALRHALINGWPVFPTHTPTADGSCSCNKRDCQDVGKHPRTLNGLLSATTEPEQIDRWYSMWPDANIGVRTGTESGIVAIDCDRRSGGLAGLALLERQHGPLPETIRARSGGGGAHIILSHPGHRVRTRAHIGNGVDCRGDGGYIIVAPSLHVAGQYTWEDGHTPFDLEPAPIPEAWLALLAPPEQPRRAAVAPGEAGRFELPPDQLAAAADLVRPYYVEGMRHDLTLALAGWLAAQKYTFDAAAGFIGELAGDDGELSDRLRNAETTYARLLSGEPILGWRRLQELLPPVTCRALETALGTYPRVVREGVSISPNGHGNGRHPEDPPPAGGSSLRESPMPGEHQTDLGNARRLVRQHGDDLRFCHIWNKWLVWDGARWAIDETGAAMRRAKATVASIYVEAGAAADPNERKAIANHAMKSEAAGKLEAMLKLAESEPMIPVQPDQLDRDPWLLNVRNGTLDLKTGALRPHDRADHITKRCPVVYDPEAACPTWLRFLDRIFGSTDPTAEPKRDLIAFVQRALGYSLTGRTSERALFIAFGLGRNGKSTLLDTMLDVLGPDYAMRTSTDTLLATKENGIPNDIARLKGARFVFASEAEEGRRLAEAKVKDLTGGDKITARFMRGEWFDFEPEFKLWLGTNHKPVIRGTDDAIWDRIRLIPFSVRIPAAEQDRDLKDKLLAEAPGILAWLVDGCLAWQREGLGTPAEVQAATTAYRGESDLIGRFIDDACVIEETARATAKDLYGAYTAWCDESGEKPVTKTMFGKRLTERGLDSARIGQSRTYYWLGIGLKSNAG